MFLGIWEINATEQVDGDVAIIDSHQVEVRRESDGLLATIYDDDGGTTPLSNPFIAEGDGSIRFYAEQSELYRIKITKSPLERTLRHQGVTTSADLSTVVSLADLADRDDPVKGDALVGCKRDPGGTGRTLHDWLHDQAFNVKDFGAKGDGATDDTSAIQAAIDAAVEAGGGIVFFPAGTYIVLKENPSGTGTANLDNFALHHEANHIWLIGEGPGLSVIKADPNREDDFVLIFIGTLPIDNGNISIKGGGIVGLEWDGGHPPDPSDTPNQIFPIYIYGVQDFVLRDLHIHHSPQYGIGLQNGGHKNILIENVLIEDCVLDAIDEKNNGNTTEECKMDNVTIRRCLIGDTSGACIDLKGEGWTLSNIHVSEFGEGSNGHKIGVRFKAGETTDSRGLGAHKSSMTNFHIKGGTVTGGTLSTRGVQVDAREVQLSNGYVQDISAEGYRFEQHEPAVSSCIARNCGIGFRTVASTDHLSDADRAMFAACEARNCAEEGFLLEATSAALAGCVARSNGVGINFVGDSNSWMGGQIGANTTQVLNSGANNIVVDAIGFRSSNQVESGPFAVNSTGTKSINIPHSLPFTPEPHQCQAVVTDSDNTDWGYRILRISGTGATNVTAGITIDRASKVGVSPTARLAVMIDATRIPQIP